MKWVLVLSIAACGSKTVATEKKDFITLATSYQGPVLIGPFTNVSLSPKLKAGDLEPKLCEREAIVPAWCEYKTDEFPNAIFRVFRQPIEESDDERDYPIGTLRVPLPGSGVRDKLAAAWGAPRDARDTAYWFNTGTKLRKKLGEPKQVDGDLVYRENPRIALDGTTIYVGEI